MSSTIPAPATPIALPTTPPQLPEWPALGQTLLPGVTSYLGRIYSTQFGYRSLTLDLHVPDGDGPFPVALYASGGGFMIGSTVIGEWQPLLQNGYAVVTINYRLYAEANHPVPTGDIVAAAQWIRAHAHEFNLDASRLVGVASSAGAYLVNFATLTRDASGAEWAPGAEPLFSAVVSFYAPTDFAALGEDSRPDVMEEPGTATSSETRYLGYITTDRPQEAALAALGVHARADAPPFLILHGDADRRVGVGQARRFAQALEEVGAPIHLLIVPGADHASPAFTSPAVIEAVVSFLDSAVGYVTCDTAGGSNDQVGFEE